MITVKILKYGLEKTLSNMALSVTMTYILMLELLVIYDSEMQFSVFVSINIFIDYSCRLYFKAIIIN